MWNGVIRRFAGLQNNLKLTDDQISDAETKYHGVVKCLNLAYWNSSSNEANAIPVGSWGKGTRVRPPRDVDILFQLPTSVYHRFEQRTGNKQSALLQEVKGHLETTYPTTAMRGDGQVILVRFNTINVEVVPAFRLTNDQFYICDTNNGGSYKTTDPLNEAARISQADQATVGNVRHLVRMAKCWQKECNVPIKSFWLENLAVDFLMQWPHSLQTTFYHDWMNRDFFRYLLSRANTFVTVAGTNELIWIGDEWKSKAETALSRATLAERYEFADMLDEAGDEWQKIYGTFVPKVLS